MPPNFWMSSVASSWTTSTMSSTVTMPLTSTSVATNGADALAGSKPMRRNSSGSIEPASVPHVTTPIKLDATVNAMSR